MVTPALGTIGWYGKLPSRGDFVGRGLPASFRREWDGWLQRGIALAATTFGSTVVRARLESFAPWRYVVLPAVEEVWCGIVVPSHDRVGRVFPLTIAQCCEVAVQAAEVATRLEALADAAMEGMEALEAAIAELQRLGFAANPAAVEWPTAPASVWWPVTAASDVPPRTAAWPPDAQLLNEMLGDGQVDAATRLVV